MFLLSLHSRDQLKLIQSNRAQFKYMQQRLKKFDIVEYFQHFGYVDRDIANASFKELVHATLLVSNYLGRPPNSFAEFHHKNNFAILNSDEAESFWSKKPNSLLQHNSATEVLINKQNVNASDEGFQDEGLSRDNKEEDSNGTRIIIEQETEMAVVGPQLLVTINLPLPEESLLLNPKICIPQPTNISLSQPFTPLPHQQKEICNNVVNEEEAFPRFINDIDMRTFRANFKPTLSSRYWMAGKKNVLKAWKFFKTQCAEKCNVSGLSVENDTQLILALSHIFYIKSNDNCDFMDEFFGKDMLGDIRKDIKAQLHINQCAAFTGNVQIEAIEVIKTLLQKNVGKRRHAAGQIMRLAVDLPEDEYLIISELVSMINYLPRRSVDLSDLCITDYVTHVIRPLFENVNAKRKLSWSKSSSSRSIDAEIVSFSGNTSRTTLLSKGKITPQDHFAQSVDLLRLTIDAKKAIDTDISSCSNKIFFQITGLRLTVYMLSLLNNGMYVLTDVADIDIPLSIEDLVPFTSKLEATLSVSRAFRSCCNSSAATSSDILSANKQRRDFVRDTLSTPKFDRLIYHQAQTE